MKPILYHDIYGVLFGEYGPRHSHQLRPGVADWFHWVLARYQLVFLTSWTQDDVFTLLNSLYLHDVISVCRYVPWMSVGLPTKWDAIKQQQHRHPHPYFWIDDDLSVFPPLNEQRAHYNRLPFIRVNPTGERQLEDLMQRLNTRTTQLKQLVIPFRAHTQDMIAPHG
ncbi:MAG: hypothetical protein ACYDAK_13405 [Candidatus Limnocylindrales bacterium]